MSSRANVLGLKDAESIHECDKCSLEEWVVHSNISGMTMEQVIRKGIEELERRGWKENPSGQLLCPRCNRRYELWIK